MRSRYRMAVRVTIRFQSRLSSSGGNCLSLWTRTSSLMFDCGANAQCRCRALVEAHRAAAGTLDALVVSHAHGDHVSRATLRVAEQEAVPIHAHRAVVRQLRERHDVDDWDDQPAFVAFGVDPFVAGDFEVTPVEVPHAPGYRNFGFVVRARSGRGVRKIVVCTDLHDYADLLPHLADADLVFVEANHDLDLLQRHPNPSSHYHLNNVKTAWLLHHATKLGGRRPKAVVLGHLSEERNSARLALGEVRRVFERQETPIDFHLDAAPAARPSDVVEI
jgi:phosphoribosyl 1,2-cyclic phosphodiesterase